MYATCKKGEAIWDVREIFTRAPTNNGASVQLLTDVSNTGFAPWFTVGPTYDDEKSQKFC